jgi:hypothetical protein
MDCHVAVADVSNNSLVCVLVTAARISEDGRSGNCTQVLDATGAGLQVSPDIRKFHVRLLSAES